MEPAKRISLLNLAAALTAYAFHYVLRPHLQDFPLHPDMLFGFMLAMQLLLWLAVIPVRRRHPAKAGFVFLGGGIVKIILVGSLVLYLQKHYGYRGHLWFVADLVGMYFIFLVFEIWSAVYLVRDLK